MVWHPPIPWLQKIHSRKKPAVSLSCVEERLAAADTGNRCRENPVQLAWQVQRGTAAEKPQCGLHMQPAAMLWSVWRLTKTSLNRLFSFGSNIKRRHHLQVHMNIAACKINASNQLVGWYKPHPKTSSELTTATKDCAANSLFFWHKHD